MSKVTLDHNAKQERAFRSSQPFRNVKRDAIADDALDSTVESSFPASDPPGKSVTRVGSPRRLS